MNLFAGKVNNGNTGIVAIGENMSVLGLTLSGQGAVTYSGVNTNNISSIKFHSELELGQLLNVKQYTYTFPASSTMTTITHTIDSNISSFTGTIAPILRAASGEAFGYNMITNSLGTRMLQFYVSNSKLLCRDVIIPVTDYSGNGSTIPQITLTFYVYYIKI